MPNIILVQCKLLLCNLLSAPRTESLGKSPETRCIKHDRFMAEKPVYAQKQKYAICSRFMNLYVHNVHCHTSQLLLKSDDKSHSPPKYAISESHYHLWQLPNSAAASTFTVTIYFDNGMIVWNLLVQLGRDGRAAWVVWNVPMNIRNCEWKGGH